MVARAAVVLLALLLAGFGAIALRDHDACDDQASRMIRVMLGEVPAQDRYVDELLDECRGSRVLALTANGLARHDRPRLAVRVADEAIRREPRNYEAWVALSAALDRRGLDAAARRAMDEARRLNPRFGQAPG